jgi:ABC-type uncharacterized transport system ATPase subunit
MDSTRLVEMHAIHKSFGSVQALQGVDFELAKGEVHAILGENGAGKTTLMNVLAGLLKPDEGSIHIKGESVEFGSPAASMKYGIGMVHQHFSLIQPLTAYENFVLPNVERNSRKRIVREEEDSLRAMKEVAETVGMSFNPKSKISSLSSNERQKLEIVRLLYFGFGIIILDEPTSALLSTEVEGLFRAIRKMRDEGKGVIFVSHKLEEIKSISDRVTVLRRGKNVGTFDSKNTSVSDLVKLMLGENPVIPEKQASVSANENPILLLQGVKIPATHGRGGVEFSPPIDSLFVKHNEIVGVVGVGGSGQKEIFDAIYGLRLISHGEIVFNGRNIAKNTTRERITAGIGYIPEDRQTVGLCPDLSIRDNIVLKDVDEYSRGLSLDGQKMNEVAIGLVQKFDIRCESILTPAKTLSGGNMQKTILAREISRNPKLLLAYEPTKGLDFGATMFVRKELLNYAQNGSVLLYSEDMEEVASLSDRIYVIHAGRLIGHLAKSEFNKDTIGRLMVGIQA